MKDVRPRIKLPVTSIKLILINRYSVHGFDFCLWKAVGVSSSFVLLLMASASSGSSVLNEHFRLFNPSVLLMNTRLCHL